MVIVTSVVGLQNDDSGRAFARSLAHVSHLPQVRLAKVLLPASQLHSHIQHDTHASEELELGNKQLSGIEMVRCSWAWDSFSFARVAAATCDMSLSVLWFVLSLIHFDSMRCDARCDAMRCDAMRCDAMRCDAMRFMCVQVYVAEALRFNPLLRSVNLRKNAGGQHGVAAIVSALQSPRQSITDVNLSANTVGDPSAIAAAVADLLRTSTCLTSLKVADMGLGVRDCITIANAVACAAGANRTTQRAARTVWQIEDERRRPRQLGSYMPLQTLRLHTVDLPVTMLLNGGVMSRRPPRGRDADRGKAHAGGKAQGAGSNGGGGGGGGGNGSGGGSEEGEGGGEGSGSGSTSSAAESNAATAANAQDGALVRRTRSKARMRPTLSTSSSMSSSSSSLSLSLSSSWRSVRLPQLPQLTVWDLAFMCALFTHHAIDVDLNELR